MRIQSVKHKGIRRLMVDDDASGLPTRYVDKIRKILAFLQDMDHEEELRAFPSWKPHRLRGNRRGTWSLVVTRNWRITFQIDRKDGSLINLDYEDYH